MPFFSCTCCKVPPSPETHQPPKRAASVGDIEIHCLPNSSGADVEVSSHVVLQLCDQNSSCSTPPPKSRLHTHQSESPFSPVPPVAQATIDCDGGLTLAFVTSPSSLTNPLVPSPTSALHNDANAPFNPLSRALPPTSSPDTQSSSSTSKLGLSLIVATPKLTSSPPSSAPSSSRRFSTPPRSRRNLSSTHAAAHASLADRTVQQERDLVNQRMKTLPNDIVIATSAGIPAIAAGITGTAPTTAVTRRSPAVTAANAAVTRHAATVTRPSAAVTPAGLTVARTHARKPSISVDDSVVQTSSTMLIQRQRSLCSGQEQVVANNVAQRERTLSSEIKDTEKREKSLCNAENPISSLPSTRTSPQNVTWRTQPTPSPLFFGLTGPVSLSEYQQAQQRRFAASLPSYTSERVSIWNILHPTRTLSPNCGGDSAPHAAVDDGTPDNHTIGHGAVTNCDTVVAHCESMPEHAPAPRIDASGAADTRNTTPYIDATVSIGTNNGVDTGVGAGVDIDMNATVTRNPDSDSRPSGCARVGSVAVVIQQGDREDVDEDLDVEVDKQENAEKHATDIVPGRCDGMTAMADDIRIASTGTPTIVTKTRTIITDDAGTSTGIGLDTDQDTIQEAPSRASAHSSSSSPPTFPSASVAHSHNPLSRNYTHAQIHTHDHQAHTSTYSPIHSSSNDHTQTRTHSRTLEEHSDNDISADEMSVLSDELQLAPSCASLMGDDQQSQYVLSSFEAKQAQRFSGYGNEYMDIPERLSSSGILNSGGMGISGLGFSRNHERGKGRFSSAYDRQSSSSERFIPSNSRNIRNNHVMGFSGLPNESYSHDFTQTQESCIAPEEVTPTAGSYSRDNISQGIPGSFIFPENRIFPNAKSFRSPSPLSSRSVSGHHPRILKHSHSQTHLFSQTPLFSQTQSPLQAVNTVSRSLHRSRTPLHTHTTYHTQPYLHHAHSFSHNTHASAPNTHTSALNPPLSSQNTHIVAQNMHASSQITQCPPQLAQFPLQRAHSLSKSAHNTPQAAYAQSPAHNIPPPSLHTHTLALTHSLASARTPTTSRRHISSSTSNALLLQRNNSSSSSVAQRNNSSSRSNAGVGRNTNGNDIDGAGASGGDGHNANDINGVSTIVTNIATGGTGTSSGMGLGTGLYLSRANSDTLRMHPTALHSTHSTHTSHHTHSTYNTDYAHTTHASLAEGVDGPPTQRAPPPMHVHVNARTQTQTYIRPHSASNITTAANTHHTVNHHSIVNSHYTANARAPHYTASTGSLSSSSRVRPHSSSRAHTSMMSNSTQMHSGALSPHMPVHAGVLSSGVDAQMSTCMPTSITHTHTNANNTTSPTHLVHANTSPIGLTQSTTVSIANASTTDTNTTVTNAATATAAGAAASAHLSDTTNTITDINASTANTNPNIATTHVRIHPSTSPEPVLVATHPISLPSLSGTQPSLSGVQSPNRSFTLRRSGSARSYVSSRHPANNLSNYNSTATTTNSMTNASNVVGGSTTASSTVIGSEVAVTGSDGTGVGIGDGGSNMAAAHPSLLLPTAGTSASPSFGNNLHPRTGANPGAQATTIYTHNPILLGQGHNDNAAHMGTGTGIGIGTGLLGMGISSRISSRLSSRVSSRVPSSTRTLSPHSSPREREKTFGSPLSGNLRSSGNSTNSANVCFLPPLRTSHSRVLVAGAPQIAFDSDSGESEDYVESDQEDYSSEKSLLDDSGFMEISRPLRQPKSRHGPFASPGKPKSSFDFVSSVVNPAYSTNSLLMTNSPGTVSNISENDANSQTFSQKIHPCSSSIASGAGVGVATAPISNLGLICGPPPDNTVPTQTSTQTHAQTHIQTPTQVPTSRPASASSATAAPAPGAASGAGAALTPGSTSAPRRSLHTQPHTQLHGANPAHTPTCTHRSTPSHSHTPACTHPHAPSPRIFSLSVDELPHFSPMMSPRDRLLATPRDAVRATDVAILAALSPLRTGNVSFSGTSSPASPPMGAGMILSSRAGNMSGRNSGVFSGNLVGNMHHSRRGSSGYVDVGTTSSRGSGTMLGGTAGSIGPSVGTGASTGMDVGPPAIALPLPMSSVHQHTAHINTTHTTAKTNPSPISASTSACALSPTFVSAPPHASHAPPPLISSNLPPPSPTLPSVLASTASSAPASAMASSASPNFASSLPPPSPTLSSNLASNVAAAHSPSFSANLVANIHPALASTLAAAAMLSTGVPPPSSRRHSHSTRVLAHHASAPASTAVSASASFVSLSTSTLVPTTAGTGAGVGISGVGVSAGVAADAAEDEVMIVPLSSLPHTPRSNPTTQPFASSSTLYAPNLDAPTATSPATLKHLPLALAPTIVLTPTSSVTHTTPTTPTPLVNMAPAHGIVSTALSMGASATVGAPHSVAGDNIPLLHATTSSNVAAMHAATTTSVPIAHVHSTSNMNVAPLHSTTNSNVAPLHSTTSSTVAPLHSTTSSVGSRGSNHRVLPSDWAFLARDIDGIGGVSMPQTVRERERDREAGRGRDTMSVASGMPRSSRSVRHSNTAVRHRSLARGMSTIAHPIDVHVNSVDKEVRNSMDASVTTTGVDDFGNVTLSESFDSQIPLYAHSVGRNGVFAHRIPSSRMPNSMFTDSVVTPHSNAPTPTSMQANTQSYSNTHTHPHAHTPMRADANTRGYAGTGARADTSSHAKVVVGNRTHTTDTRLNEAADLGKDDGEEAYEVEDEGQVEATGDAEEEAEEEVHVSVGVDGVAVHLQHS